MTRNQNSVGMAELPTNLRIAMSWARLNLSYGKEGLFLALGAGLSVGCGLPSWVELLKRVGRACFDKSGEHLVEDLRNGGFSYPALAAVLFNQCGSAAKFTEIIRHELYRDFPFFPGGIGKENFVEFVDFVHQSNSTLRSVGSLCCVRDNSTGRLARNPKLHAIVNFNLDAVLRAYVYARARGRVLRTIERPSKTTRP